MNKETRAEIISLYQLQDSEADNCFHGAQEILRALERQNVAADAYFVDEECLPGEEPERGHAFVVPEEFGDDELPFNMLSGPGDIYVGDFYLSCGQVRRWGQIITDEVKGYTRMW